MIPHLARTTIVAKLEANFMRVKVYVAVNAIVAIAELDELAAAIDTEFTAFKTRLTQIDLDFDTEDSLDQFVELILSSLHA